MAGDTFTNQRRPDEIIDLLRPEFQHRDEAGFAYRTLASALLGLPFLRAAWIMSSVGYTSVDQARDISGAGYHLVNNNVALFGYDGLIPYVEFNGTNQYLSRADGGPANWADITGTEAFVPTAQQGLTFGGWFYFDDAAPPAAQEILIGKRTAAVGNLSYWLLREPVNGRAVFSVSSDGTAITEVNSNPDVLTNGLWYFIAGRFDNSGNTIDLFANNTSYSAVFNNTIFDGNADLTIGSGSGGFGYHDGRTSACFLCAGAVSNMHARMFYEYTRPLYGHLGV